MNVPLIVAGSLAILSAAIYGAGGEVLVVRQLSPGMLPSSRFGGPRTIKLMIGLGVPSGCRRHTNLIGELTDLLASLVAFLAEHRYCGKLDGGADEDWIWMTCTCGGVISWS